MAERTCDGKCCAAFAMPGIAQLRADPASVADGPYILDMLVPLTHEQAVERWTALGFGEFPAAALPADAGVFTCRHWDEETGLCGAYDQRPAMCRDFPYGRPCVYGCGYQVPDPDAAAERQAIADDSAWQWVPTHQGWRPRSTSEYEWDATAGLLRRRSA
jgi:Fe-S-cluster containining protein